MVVAVVVEQSILKAGDCLALREKKRRKAKQITTKVFAAPTGTRLEDCLFAQLII